MTEETETEWAEWANWFLAGILVFILGAYMYRYLNPNQPEGLVGSSAPALQLESARGEGQVRVSEYRGQVVVLDFWATWCKVCERQMPKLKEAMNRSEIADRATLVLVNTQEKQANRRKRVRRYLAKRNLEFPTALDDGSAIRDYRVRGLPTMVVIDAEGTV
ncbi:MAG: TlpA family protein disulfide reductase, partial [Bradymonadaceae bacterium]